MKKRLLIALILVAFCLSACSGMSVSDTMYCEVRDYVLQNADTLSHREETAFFEYKTDGFVLSGVLAICSGDHVSSNFSLMYSNFLGS